MTPTQRRVDRTHRNNQPERTTTKQQHQNGWKEVKKDSHFVRQRNRPHKNQSQNVVGANIGIYSSDVQPQPRRNYR